MPSIALNQWSTPVAPGGSISSIATTAFGSACNVGDVIGVWLTFATGGGSVSSVVDSASQSYTLEGSITDVTDSQIFAYYSRRANGSATTLQVLVNFSASVSFAGISSHQIINAKNQAPLAVNFPAPIVSPGTSTDAISVPLTYTVQNALVVGFAGNVAGTGSSTAAGGTGFSTSGGFPSGQTGFGGFQLNEAGRFTIANQPATWTDSTAGGTKTYLAAGVVWAEVAAAGGNNNQQLPLLQAKLGMIAAPLGWIIRRRQRLATERRRQWLRTESGLIVPDKRIIK